MTTTDRVEVSLKVDKRLGVLRMTTQLVRHLIITTNQASTDKHTYSHFNFSLTLSQQMPLNYYFVKKQAWVRDLAVQDQDQE